MKYSTVLFDLDGTLLRSDKSISPRTMQALLAARERGVLLVPSTGRLLRSLPEPLLDKSLTRYHILVNGAQVYDSFEDKTLLREELTPQQAMCMLHFLKSHNGLRGVYIDGLGHMSREDFSEIEAVAATPATAALMLRAEDHRVFPQPARQAGDHPRDHRTLPGLRGVELARKQH